MFTHGTTDIISSLSAGALNADLVPSFDVAPYSMGIIQVLGTFTGTLTFQGSNDGTNFSSILATNTSATSTPSATTTTTGMYAIPLGFKYLRVRMTAYTSGTATGTLGLSNVPSEAIVNAVNVISGTVNASGTTAHDSVGTSVNPVKVGGRAISANYTAVSSGDLADFITTLAGALITKPYSIPESDWQYGNIVPITTATTTTLKAAGAAGIRNYVTGIQFINSSATVGVVSIQDGTTVIWAAYAPQNVPVTVNFETPLRGTAATAMNFVTSMSGIVTVSAQGYQAP